MPKNTPPRKDHNRVPRAPRNLAPAEPREAERVAKVIARVGLGSRREIEEWIVAGRVTVNGEVLDTPARTVTAEDVITVDGNPLPAKERTRLFLYHKPKGVVTTNYDPEGRPTLFEILPGGLPRLVSVGRLDLNTEGLILLTNDGGLSRVLELPETGWLRRYRVRAKGSVSPEKLDALIAGITVDGVHYGPIEAKLDRVQGANSWLTLALREGKNREVRNVLGALGLEVNRLIRLSYGPFQLGELGQGAVEEVRTRVLADQLGPELSAAAAADFEGPMFDHAGAEEEAPRSPPPSTSIKNARYAKVEGAEDRHRRKPISTEQTTEQTVTAGIVADRKGRKVLVQRVRSVETEEPREERPARPSRFRGDGERQASRPDSRGGERTFRRRPAEAGERRWEAPEGEGAGGEERRSFHKDKPARKGPGRDRASGPRPARPRPAEDAAPRREGGERPFRQREEGERSFRPREGGDRPPRREGGERPFRQREEGERSFRPREGGDRPPRREGGERPFRQREEGERSFRPREGGDRPPRRESSDRPYSGRVKSEGGNRERAFRADREDRPRKPYGGKSGEGGRSFGDKPRGERSFGDKPAGRPAGKSFAGKSFSGKPGGGKSFGGKPGGGKPRGDRPSGGGKPFGGKPGGAGGGKPRGRG